MHKPLLALSLLTTLLVSGITVRLQVRARLRTYELARARESIVELTEQCDAVRVRLLAAYAPERVLVAAQRRRDGRRAGPAQTTQL